jgi:virulence-associated protein VapD
MMKMIIRMNDYKIAKDNQYSLQDIYNTLNHMFLTVGLSRIESEANALTYVDNSRAEDFSLFGQIVNVLKKQSWFMDNVSAWLFYEKDDDDTSDTFTEEDLLEHYTVNNYRQGSGYISNTTFLNNK